MVACLLVSFILYELTTYAPHSFNLPIIGNLNSKEDLYVGEKVK